jgi:hypothetical protein
MLKLIIVLLSTRGAAAILSGPMPAPPSLRSPLIVPKPAAARSHLRLAQRRLYAICRKRNTRRQ